MRVGAAAETEGSTGQHNLPVWVSGFSSAAANQTPLPKSLVTRNPVGLAQLNPTTCCALSASERYSFRGRSPTWWVVRSVYVWTARNEMPLENSASPQNWRTRSGKSLLSTSFAEVEDPRKSPSK